MGCQWLNPLPPPLADLVPDAAVGAVLRPVAIVDRLPNDPHHPIHRPLNQFDIILLKLAVIRIPRSPWPMMSGRGGQEMLRMISMCTLPKQLMKIMIINS